MEPVGDQLAILEGKIEAMEERLRNRDAPPNARRILHLYQQRVKRLQLLHGSGMPRV